MHPAMVAGVVPARDGDVLVANADGTRAVAANPVHEDMPLLEAMKVGHL